MVTAAHCVTNLIDHLELYVFYHPNRTAALVQQLQQYPSLSSIHSVLVRLGELDASRTDNLCTDGQANCMTAQDYPIESVVHHSAYDTPKYSNDIALIRLRRVSPENTPIALCLPIGAFAVADSAATSGIIAGWGATSPGELEFLKKKKTIDSF